MKYQGTESRALSKACERSCTAGALAGGVITYELNGLRLGAVASGNRSWASSNPAAAGTIVTFGLSQPNVRGMTVRR